MKKIVIKVGLGVLIALMVGGGILYLTGGPLVDLKPDVITVAPQPEREARGRALLQGAWEAVGGEQTFARPALHFLFDDQWQGAAQLFTPWPDVRQRARVTLQTHTFNSRFELLNGERKGTTWGIDNGRGWTEVNGTRSPSEDSDLLFILPTVHYFVELSQRLTEAKVVRWVDERVIDGTTYDVVLATWKTVEGHDDADQYLVYVDQQTRRIGWAHFTVREVARFATGACKLEDYREVGGVWIPHRITIFAEPGDAPAEFMHRMTLSKVKWLDAYESAAPSRTE